ncbi:hypothetical protein [Hymenobacter persicinus]|uniref:Uncharacterized protein n=1 Tax=Hymenobacter persicinus TaxID=2025506 RepID=A0A4Q5LDA6_9BACT|nr:hypothetical protein [Hymenobacter persicinus]RYU81026.1 hypothetical protein EWM57_07235 [Hymenobacter persicinus]
MSKILLLLFCALMIFADTQPVLANPPGVFLFRSKARITEGSHMPNYKKYRGNSRHKARKLGVYKRWRLRCKAKHKAHKIAQPRTSRTTL